MSDSKEQLIKEYNLLLNKTLSLSKIMLDLAENEQIERLLFECDNRERLIENFKILDQKVEQYALEDNSLKESNKLNKSFFDKINNLKELFITEINNINDKMLEILNQTKDKTTKEISLAHKNKKIIHSYNLSSVK
ncbi:MAG: hypothetical protein HQK49_08435 [Oligoflexia bacterium]|nr:hypothetical protein [Oligoflexia bacterium]